MEEGQGFANRSREAPRDRLGQPPGRDPGLQVTAALVVEEHPERRVAYGPQRRRRACSIGQTLHGSFSAVPKLIFASKYKILI